MHCGLRQPCSVGLKIRINTFAKFSKENFFPYKQIRLSSLYQRVITAHLRHIYIYSGSCLALFLHYPGSEHRHLFKSPSAGGMGVVGRLEIQTHRQSQLQETVAHASLFFSIIQEVNTGICLNLHPFTTHISRYIRLTLPAGWKIKGHRCGWMLASWSCRTRSSMEGNALTSRKIRSRATSEIVDKYNTDEASCT